MLSDDATAMKTVCATRVSRMNVAGMLKRLYAGVVCTITPTVVEVIGVPKGTQVDEFPTKRVKVRVVDVPPTEEESGSVINGNT